MADSSEPMSPAKAMEGINDPPQADDTVTIRRPSDTDDLVVNAKEVPVKPAEEQHKEEDPSTHATCEPNATPGKNSPADELSPAIVEGTAIVSPQEGSCAGEPSEEKTLTEEATKESTSEVSKDIAPKDIAPKDIAPKDIAPKDIAPKDIAEPKDVGNKEAVAIKEAAPKEAEKKVGEKKVIDAPGSFNSAISALISKIESLDKTLNPSELKGLLDAVQTVKTANSRKKNSVTKKSKPSNTATGESSAPGSPALVSKPSVGAVASTQTASTKQQQQQQQQQQTGRGIAKKNSHANRAKKQSQQLAANNIMPPGNGTALIGLHRKQEQQQQQQMAKSGFSGQKASVVQQIINVRMPNSATLDAGITSAAPGTSGSPPPGPNAFAKRQKDQPKDVTDEQIRRQLRDAHNVVTLKWAMNNCKLRGDMTFEFELAEKKLAKLEAAANAASATSAASHQY